jgi:hypothetical protein
MTQVVKSVGNRAVAVAASMLLVLCMVPAVSLTAYADDPAVISVGAPEGGVPEGGYARGATFSVPVSISNNPGFAALCVTMQYDSSALELTGFDTSSSTLLSGLSATSNGDSIGIYDFDTDHLLYGINVEGDGLLFNVSFAVKSDAPAGATSISIALKDGAPKNFVANSGGAVVAMPVSFEGTSVSVAAAEQVGVPYSGDIDGDGVVTSSDALKVLRAVYGLETLSSAQLLAADFDQDGYLTSSDSVKIQRHVYGLA